MNTNPNAIKILCYGDSNTWGDSPHANAPRYPANVRWTGKLQEKLDNEYEVIEEGLCGRTTVPDDPKEEGRSGIKYLVPCLKTHNPIDIVILMLGSNDLKERFNLTAEDVANNVSKLIETINKIGVNKKNKPPQIILISPPLVNEHPKGVIGKLHAAVEGIKLAEEKSKQFEKYYQEITKKYNCVFIDISKYVKPSDIDGLHLDPEAHSEIAKVLAERILKTKF